MVYTTQIERDINNMLLRIEMDQDVEAAMEAQIEIIDQSGEFEEKGGFRLMHEEIPDCQTFPQPYHFRWKSHINNYFYKTHSNLYFWNVILSFLNQ